MLDFLPNYLKNTTNFKALVGLGESQFNKLDTFYDDCINQLYVDTATWMLDYWDKQAGIKTSLYPIEERRKRINAKLASLKPLSSPLKAIIYDAEIEFKSSYLFQVILKSSEEFGNIVNFIFDQIDLRKPAHLSYELVLDYFTILSIRVLFNRYFSEILTPCGTIDVSGNKIVTTLGRSYDEILKEILKTYNSSKLIVASESTFSIGMGKSYIEKIYDKLNSYFSELFFNCSENTFITGYGRSFIEEIQIKGNSYFSSKLYTYDQTIGKSYQETVKDSVTNNYSTLKCCSENLINTALYDQNEELISSSGSLYLTKLPVTSEEIYCKGDGLS